MSCVAASRFPEESSGKDRELSVSTLSHWCADFLLPPTHVTGDMQANFYCEIFAGKTMYKADP